MERQRLEDLLSVLALARNTLVWLLARIYHDSIPVPDKFGLSENGFSGDSQSVDVESAGCTVGLAF